jgi:hypothetical protein
MMTDKPQPTLEQLRTHAERLNAELQQLVQQQAVIRADSEKLRQKIMRIYLRDTVVQAPGVDTDHPSC